MMKEISLGRSGIRTGQLGLECGPLLKRSFAESRALMERALDAGIRFLDIGLPIEELQKRVGHAIAGRRRQIVLAGSFAPCAPEAFKDQLKMVLRALKSDYLDLCQIHDPDYLPRTGDAEGFYDAMTDAKKAGYIRSIGITTGSEDVALHALEYGWYDTLQFPWGAASSEELLEYIGFTHEVDMGSISVPPEEYPDDIAHELEALAQYGDHLFLFPLEEGDGLDALLAMSREERL